MNDEMKCWFGLKVGILIIFIWLSNIRLDERRSIKSMDKMVDELKRGKANKKLNKLNREKENKMEKCSSCAANGSFNV